MTSDKLLVLRIDDEYHGLRLFSIMLERYGYEPITAHQPREGLALAFERRPHIILLDNMMPDMDGYEVCRRLRADERTRNTVILFLSPSMYGKGLDTAYECGADEAYPLPMHPQAVRDVLAKLTPIALERRHAEPTIIIGGNPDSTQ